MEKTKEYHKVTAGKVASYMFMPGIIPRIRHFVKGGFANLAFLMATIYGSVRLLPVNHPYLLPANKGRFGLRHVMAEAASRLRYDRQHLDQVLIFYALLLGFILLALQFVYMFFTLLVHPALAGPPPPFVGMFSTPVPDTDIAFMLLDSVFGIPNLFNSCIAQGISCGPTSPTPMAFPTPFQIGLHSLFAFYSLAMLLVAVLIILYYILIIVGETAQTGTPFGARFDHIWAPLRLVMAIGLLVPVNYGLNSGQYIVLIAARMGSGFATNGWNLYNFGLANALGSPAANVPSLTIGTKTYAAPPTSENNVLIARPATPDIAAVVQFMTLVQACRVGYATLQNITILPYLIKEGSPAIPVPNVGTPDWPTAVAFYNNQDITIRFGDDGDDPSVYPNETSNVKPFCGEITVHTRDLQYLGTKDVQQGYYDWVIGLFYNGDYEDYGVRAACIHLSPKPQNGYPLDAQGHCTNQNFGPRDDIAALPPEEWKQAANQNEWNNVNAFVETAWQDMINSTNFAVPVEVLNRGWGGAGIWYNKIAQWNGAFISAVKTVPTPSKMPIVMEVVQKSLAAHDQNIDPENRYAPDQAGGQNIDFSTVPSGEQLGRMFNDVYKNWRVYNTTSTVAAKAQGNIIIDAMHLLFGVDGLYDIRTNDHVHPLAQLVAIGKSIMDGAIRNLGLTLAFSAGGGLSEVMKWPTAGGFAALGQFFSTFTTLGLSVGFTLYYVLPFMPFLYFYFAVGAWVKTIFEAMIGVPLWALAHLRIDGTGLPTNTAIDGYYLILEIFVRPILTVFGLLAAMATFAAFVRTLNGLFTLVTQNVTGFDCGGCADGVTILGDYEMKRSVIDDFFFTIMYTILVYMIGMSSFKMIDQVPDNVLRWMGSGAAAFADQGSMPPEMLESYSALGAQQIAAPLVQESASLAAEGGRAIGGVANLVDKFKMGTPQQGLGK